MGKCKEIEIKVIPAKIANDFVKKHHYSGKVVPNSTLHFGVFLGGGCTECYPMATQWIKRKRCDL